MSESPQPAGRSNAVRWVAVVAVFGLGVACGVGLERWWPAPVAPAKADAPPLERRLSGPAEAQPPPLWGKLPAGPYAVGYKSGWQLDHSRRYNITFDDRTTYAPGKAPRPVLVNLWYPASEAGAAGRMPHRGYLDIHSDDARLARFSAKLAEYNRGVIAKEVMGKPAAETTGREKALLEQFLDTPTACERDAPPAAGPFPLVIYHSGAGSSFEDNSVLCELLASHGFVVVGSAFQEQSGKGLHTDNREGSAADMAFLIAYARQLPGVDWGHVGVVGHSAGAQAALTYRSRADCAVDAVVSLDTTQEYRGLSDPSWEFTKAVVKGGHNVTCPVLMAAGPHAFFELADTLANAPRYYFTVKGLDHNDYISQGLVSRERLHQLHLGDPASSADARAEEKAGPERARAAYHTLCVYVLRFLEAELKGDAAGKGYLAKQHRDTQFGYGEPHVEYVPPGRTGPDAYNEDSDAPPTPRQLRPFLRAHGSARTIAVMRRFRKAAPTHPIYDPHFGLFLVSDLLDKGKTADAVAFRDYYREAELDCGKVFLQIGKGYQQMGLSKWAVPNYRRVLLLDPANAEAAAGLKKFSEGKKDDGGP